MRKAGTGRASPATALIQKIPVRKGFIIMLPQRMTRGNIVSPYLLRRPPEAIPRQTQETTVDGYLQECRDRLERGWTPHYWRTIDQGIAAYARHLCDHKPHEHEPDAVHFRGLRPEPLDEEFQDRLLATAAADPQFCRAFSRLVKRGCQS